SPPRRTRRTRRKNTNISSASSVSSVVESSVPASDPSEIHPESQLLLPLRKLGRRRAERRRLEARLEIREVVGVEQVEDFPEAGGDQAAAELERLADT